MYVEIDNAKLVEGELFYCGCNTEVIDNVKSMRVTKNNRFVAISTSENYGLNCILVDMLKFNITCFEGKSSKNL